MAKKCIKMYRFSCKNNCFKILMVVYFVYFRQTSASDFFIAKQFDSDNYVCVTNSSYPMSWIQEEIESRLTYSPFFIPTTNPNDFDSTISVRDPTTRRFARIPWSIVNNSLNSEINEIILDRRWEGLDFYMTEFVVRKNAFLKYLLVLKNLKSDFEIPLSIRLKQEGHIFLCDGNYPPNSNCYWLMLQAKSGKKSAIRKCGAGYIPHQHGKFPKEPCSNILSELNHEKDPNSLYISNQKWSHIKLTKKENILSLFSVNNNKKEKVILNLEDKDPIHVTHMIIHSKEFNGLWKIHNLKFIYTKEESSRIHSGNPIIPQDHYLCINFFIAMCTFCTLTVTLEDYENYVIEEKVYKYKSPGWSEIKFTTGNIRKPNNPIKFLVSTSSSSPDRFWAIDDIRICQKKEFRVISLQEKAKCQLMSEEDNVISILPGAQRLNSRCPENTIGDFCVPCDWVFKNCERIEVCQEDKCVCSAGYTLYKDTNRRNYECFRTCESSFYGHGCLKQCPNCWNSECNHIDGTCNYQGQCLNNYTGPKCDTQCRSHQFQCSNGNCIDGYLRCNRRYDCIDGSDEFNCPIEPPPVTQPPPPPRPTTLQPLTCSPGYQPCHSANKCILPSQFCDGVAHCSDMSDETNCHPALIFKKPPEIIKIDYFEAVVVVRDFTIRKRVPEEPENYFFQYKKADANIFEWTKFGSEIKFNERKKITIKNLEADTKYLVRAVIVSDKKISYETWYVKYSSFKTKCDDLTKDDIITKPSKSTVVISIRNTKKICNVGPYSKEIKSGSSPTNIRLLLSTSKTNNQNTSADGYSLVNLGNFKLVFNCTLNKSLDSFDLIIGDNKQPVDCEKTRNPPLHEDTEYNITIILVNGFSDKDRNKNISLTFTTNRNIEFKINNNYFFSLFALLLLLPVFYYMKYKKQACVCSKLRVTDTLQGNLNTVSYRCDHHNQELNLLETHDYQNCTRLPSKVQAKKFYNYVKTTESCGQLKKQHQIIMETLTPYDIIFENFQLEYIDVKYISGYQLRKVYIATQRPKKSEINRFWKIIWDENVQYIVLCDPIPNNGHKRTFEKYWPEQNENMHLENIFIKCNASKKYQFYTCRTFTVKQLHFSSNNTENLSTIKYVGFFQAISNIPLDANSPILIHSSYRMSENCFVLLCDISLRLARRDGVIDVMDTLRKLTEFSPQLIVDYDRYVLAHKIILEGLLYKKTSTDCNSSQTNDYIIPITPQEEQYHLKYLEKTWPLDCYSKNNGDIDSKQIRRILVDGFKSEGKFLVISHSSKDRVEHFWKQMEDENISLIISVNGDVSMYLYKEISSMQLSSGIIIKKINIKNFNTFEWITVEMNNQRNIEIFSMKNWPTKTILPENVSDFVNFCQETNEILNKHKSIAVTCHDGLTAAGLYITMSYNIQKIKTEGVSDICTCIRLIRSQCQHFFRNKILYKFLIEATNIYVDEFGLYEVR